MQFIAAIDQGTTSTRCILFDRAAPIASAQAEHRQIFPKPGWVEHDPLEIWERTQQVMRNALAQARTRARDIAAIGIANQRETAVVWERKSGQPIYNAIVWQDTRTQAICDELAEEDPRGKDRFRDLTGLPLATYFSASKFRWILDNVSGARRAARDGDLLCGTIDTWLIWLLTGGPDGGRHVTDVTNASRTLLMNLRTLDWDATLLEAFEIPRSMLPKIVPSSDPSAFGATRPGTPWEKSVPICGVLGDQQAALVGQACFKPGQSKNTYGTGCFMLLNTGQTPVMSNHGMLTTVAYQFANQRPVYALEGSVAIAGALVQWLRDNLGLIAKSDEIEALARTVPDNAGVYFVPAFSGLFAPHWRPDARGVIVGMTHQTHRGHLARAALEATAFQTRDVADAMEKDAGVPLTLLKVDGGMVVDELLMQFQADILNVNVVRPKIIETTALGAAYAAGLAIGHWKNLDDLSSQWKEDKTWSPSMDQPSRDKLYRGWQRAVERSLNLSDVAPT